MEERKKSCRRLPPGRIKNHLPLANYYRDNFYTFDAQGYTDYPAYEAALRA